MPSSIPYGKQNITPEDIAAVTQALQHDYLTQGPAIDVFEKDFANYIGCKQAVAVSNGTAALHLAYLALGVKPGSKVLSTPISFAATSNAVLYCGGAVEFVDVNPRTGLMDLDLLEQKLRQAPPGTYHGVSPVDFAGLPVDLERVKKIADEFDLFVVEDACHAPGGSFIDSNGTPQNCGNGTYADAAIFSFHPVKHIACGEGGMVTTNNEYLAHEMRKLRTHGITKNPSELGHPDGGWYYEMQLLGLNYRLTDFQSALGSSQLKRADAGLAKRKAIAEKYMRAFEDSPVQTLHLPDHVTHAYHLFVVSLNNREEVYNHLKANQIFAQVHYIPITSQPYYRNLGFDTAHYPGASTFYKGCLSLPMYPTLSEDDQNRVIEKVMEAAK